MERPLLPNDQRLQLATDVVAKFHREIVDHVADTVAREAWVVVGMKQNPVVRKARAFLDAEGIPHVYLEYGSYASKWKERLAIKLWAGFPTYPMIFQNGRLVGGLSELKKLREAGSLNDAAAAVRA